jgi:hypothetical protein
MKVRNVIGAGAVVATSVVLSGIGSAYTVVSARTLAPVQLQGAHSSPTLIPPGYFRPNRNTIEVLTSPFSVTARDDIYVPAGQFGSITAYPLFEDVNFQVWQNQWVGSEHQIGSGYALRPIGVC